MADYSTRTVTKTSYETVLPNPTVGAELEKAWVVARRQFSTVTGRDVQYDDDIRVRATDEEIVLFFEREEQ